MKSFVTGTLFPAAQKLGRSLMLPIAVLPVAGLLLRLGQDDLLNLPFMAAAGDAVFSHLGLLFAIGVAVGLARGNNGAAGLAAAVAYFVTTEGARTLIPVPPEAFAAATALNASEYEALLKADFLDGAIGKMSVPVGLICGIVAGWLYNRYAEIRLPDYLAFFAGRRFVPIVSGVAGLGLALLFGFGWPAVETGMNALSEAVVGAGGVGLFIFGLLNRLLIITGLHHILNNIAWFIVGDFEGVTGDLRRFFAGDPSAGAFMAGFFPVMMFGLPAACLAMYHCAEPARRKAVGGLLLSMGLTSFLTGITEPIEFTFMFVAPVLYAVHAVLTGISMTLMDLLGVRHGFGFSAGLFDYVLNFGLATRPWMVPVIGAVWFAMYYVTFRWAILRFNIPTPGRGPVTDAVAGDEAAAPLDTNEETAAILAALGGAGNLADIDACTTRLRLRVADQGAVNEAGLKRLGAAGVLRPTADTLQVIMGLRADEIADNLRCAASAGPGQTATTARLPAPAVAAVSGQLNHEALLAALGGAGNVDQAEALGTRLAVRLADPARADAASVQSAGFRGLATLPGGLAHVLCEGDAAQWIDARAD
ncbi:PTS N-acetyl-D-glucosamine transporter [Marinihelvus fidelis]|uniref:PTS N-acetyl-D-glucosamine transporter n=1 Tax=Marinihelvus fidelis TaxID=2613842 RepID=A0A5N0TFX4_9GAMM|nr:N-acetylglucosamine-specific PTS transporter subunit IIBC [Marinihelvus fidelis]KAA9132776.1 PTS N-acetyl-D-glucosamine transporter [Marinihelvus fidelis]